MSLNKQAATKVKNQSKDNVANVPKPTLNITATAPKNINNNYTNLIDETPAT